MKRVPEASPDVFLSCATADLALADTVVQQLSAAGLVVRRVSELEWQQAVAADRVETVWAALRTSSTLIVLGTRGHVRSPVLTMEVGAALASRKPIVVLVSPDVTADLPTYLQRQHVLPLSELARLTALLEERVPSLSSKRRPTHSSRSRVTR
jgi:hypothetical protein